MSLNDLVDGASKIHMSLNDLVDEASKIYSQIKSIDGLKQESAKIEEEIFRRLVEKKETLDNPILDYCFSLNFSRKTINGADVYKSGFDILQYIKLFFKMIEENKGTPILTMDEEVPDETGRIADKCFVKIKRSGKFNYRELYVPVGKVQVFDLSKNEWRTWETWEGNDIFITPDIFLYPNEISNPSLDRIWQTDYSRAVFVGGKPKEKTIYVGLTPFRESRNVKIKKEVIVPEPNFF